MRILSILPYSPPSVQFGGAERQMHALHKGLKQRGLDIHVLADIRAVGARFQKFEGLPVWGVSFPTLTSHPLRPGNVKLWRDWKKIHSLVSKSIPRPDLIQVTTFRQPALLGYWLAQKLDVPWVVRLACSGSYGDFTFSMNNWLSRWQIHAMTRSVTKVVALDQATFDEAIRYGVSPERVVIIPNGLIFKRSPSWSGKCYSSKLIQIIFVGRLAMQKRVATLLTAVADIGRSAINIHKLRIVGSGDQRELLEEQALELGITDRCDFTGSLEWPEVELRKANLFVNPSESEGLPNAVLEAAAFGLPLILSDIPVHREIADAVGMTDYLFPVGDSAALAAALTRFIALSAIDKERLSSQCVEFGKRFKPHYRDQAYLDLYDELVPGSTN